MSREIKFRGMGLSDEKLGKWQHGYLLDVDKIGIIHSLSHEYTYVDLRTIGQFTGFHDKNGKEIFEGDIVRQIEAGWTDSCEHCGSLLGENEKAHIRQVADIRDTDWLNEEVEAIGNIYENEELLK